MGRTRRDDLEVKSAVETRVPRRTPRTAVAPRAMEPVPEGSDSGRRVFLGKAVERGYGERPRLSLDAAASFATLVDTARARAAMEGRTLVYTVRWG